VRISVVTPRLFVATHEANETGASEHDEAARIADIVALHEADPWTIGSDYAYLFSDHRSLRVWFCHRLLRAISLFQWTPSALAFLPLRLCREEILESLRGCDPDVVSGRFLKWGSQLARFLSRNCPAWLVAPDAPAEVRLPARPSVDSRSRVSIVLPTLNGVRYLRQSIESCLSQTFDNIELIVVDDGSGPDLRETVEPYLTDGRVKYVRHEQNQGVAASLNTGFRLATGSHLTWTSDDNYYEPHAIESMLKFLARFPDVDFVYAESLEVDEAGSVIRPLRPKARGSLRINNFIGACFLYTRRVYEMVGDYRPVPLTEDYDYWIRVALTCRIQRLSRPLYYYRAHPASLTGRHSPQEVEARVTQVKRLNRFGSRRNRWSH
jgi:GT2 family glycosyltransferase